MTIKWGSCASLFACLMFMMGCRTPQPVLKPKTVPEVLTSPEARHNSPEYPKQAFDAPQDPTKLANAMGNGPGMNGGKGGGMMPTGGMAGS